MRETLGDFGILSELSLNLTEGFSLVIQWKFGSFVSSAVADGLNDHEDAQEDAGPNHCVCNYGGGRHQSPYF